MKKIAIAFLSLIFLILAAIVIIPLVVDVDKYRPQIITAANERINGKLELGKLSLSLWGQIRVDVAGVGLLDRNGKKILGVQDAYFHVPFSSILSGSPVLTFKMNEPEIHVIKNKAGKMNVMELVKESTAAPSQGVAGKPGVGGSKEPTALPGIVTRARLGVELRNAKLTYHDELTALDTKMRNLNLVLKDVSLSRPTVLEFWADLDTKMGQTLTVRGPARMDGRIQPTITQNKLDHVAVTAQLNLDGLDIVMPGTFEKKKGVAANGELSILASPQEAKVEKFDFKFFNAEIHAAGTAKIAEPASIHLSIQSNEIQLKPWVELLPMLKEYQLGGSAQFDAKAQGPSDKLGYEAQFKVVGLTAAAGKLKAQPRIDAIAHIVTDQMDRFQLTMKAPGNEFSINGKVQSFTHPRADFEVTSSGMDLDQLIEFPKTPAKAEAPAAPGQKPVAPSPNPAVPVVDQDAAMDPLRANPMAATSSAIIRMNLKKIKVRDIVISDIGGKLFFGNPAGGPSSDLSAGIEGFGMKVWGGTIQASFATLLRPKAPTYKFSAKIAGLDLKQAVSSQMALFKNTLYGKASFDANGEGASFNPDPAIARLKMKGNLRVEQATFASIDVGKMTVEALNQAVEKIAEKLPQAKGKGVTPLPGRESKYDLVSSDFSIADGVFTAPNFFAKAAPNQGVDIKGSTTVGLKDKSLKTQWEIIDTYNLTHAKDLSIEQAGVKIDHLLAEGNNPVRFPVSAACTLTQPCYSYTQVPEYLAGIALANVSRAVSGKAKAEVQKKAQELIQKASPEVQDKLKGIGKKLFGG